MNKKMTRPLTRALVETTQCLMVERLSARVSSRSMAHIDNEFIPIIEELASLEPGNDQHLSVRTIYNWLVDPQRTAEEFSYLIGPLEHHVFITILGHPHGSCRYVGKMATEALAVRCPILEGPWETVAWFVIRLISDYTKLRSWTPNNYGYASDQLSNWIINVIGDIDLCPSPYLRIELMHLLWVMVKLNAQNQRQALQSVLSAVTDLNLDYFTIKYNNGYFVRNYSTHGFFNMTPRKIIQVIDMFSTPELELYLFNFDVKLAKELNDIYYSQLSIRINGFTSNHSVNPNKCTEPKELQPIKSLLMTLKENIYLEFNRLQEHINDGDWRDLNFLTNTLLLLFGSFLRLFETPQLVKTAASCVVDLIELVILANVGLRKARGRLNTFSFQDIEELLKELFDEEGSKSPLGRQILCCNERLQNVKKKFQSVKIAKFQIYCPKLYCLLHDGYIWQTDF